MSAAMTMTTSRRAGKKRSWRRPSAAARAADLEVSGWVVAAVVALR